MLENIEKQREYHKKWYREHIEERKEYQKRYRRSHYGQRKEYNKKYRRKHKEEMAEYHKKYYREHAEERTWNQNHPKEFGAAMMVRYAVVHGQIIKPSKCARCGEERKVVGHHADYDKPLEVEWVCHSCHKEIHAENSIIRG